MLTFESFFVRLGLIVRRIFRVMGTGFTKVVNWRYVYICQRSVVSVGFTRNLYAVNSILGESFLELLMECYQSLFHYDLVAKSFS